MIDSKYIDKGYSSLLKAVISMFRREYTSEIFPALDMCIDSLNECYYAWQFSNALNVLSQAVQDAYDEGFNLDLDLSEFCYDLVDIHNDWVAEHDALEAGVL